MTSDPHVGASSVEASADAAAVMAADAASVQSHVEYVLDGQAGALDTEQRRVLENAWRNSRRLARLAEDLRDVFLAETGQLDLVPVDVDLAGLLEQAVERAWPVACAGKKAIDLNHEGRGRTAGDRELIERAVGALVDHATDQAAEGTIVSITARDQAVEIDFATGSARAGDPLGLAVAEAFAKLHGGGLTVDAGDGRTVLTLSLATAAAVPQAA